MTSLLGTQRRILKYRPELKQQMWSALKSEASFSDFPPAATQFRIEVLGSRETIPPTDTLWEFCLPLPLSNLSCLEYDERMSCKEKWLVGEIY